MSEKQIDQGRDEIESLQSQLVHAKADVRMWHRRADESEARIGELEGALKGMLNEYAPIDEDCPDLPCDIKAREALSKPRSESLADLKREIAREVLEKIRPRHLISQVKEDYWQTQGYNYCSKEIEDKIDRLLAEYGREIRKEGKHRGKSLEGCGWCSDPHD